MSRAQDELRLAPDVADSRPLIAHLLYSFSIGGLENGIVNLINRMPAQQFRHAVIALTEIDPEFARRIVRGDVQFISLHKPPGQGIWQYPALYRLFRKLKPAVLHTRNFVALEAAVPAWAAGVQVRIHGEHGRDVNDLDGSRRRYQWLRRLYAPFVHRWTTVSVDLERYLLQAVGIAPDRVRQIYNGVDTERFQPARGGRQAIPGSPFNAPEFVVIGTAGRMQAVKDQLTLARAFGEMLKGRPDLRASVRLVMAGDGPLRAQVMAELMSAGLADLAWLPGDRSDVPAWMNGLDVFVLPSLAEGVSNTILEAMACALPVVATEVGGNCELVQPEVTGWLVPAADPGAMAERMLHLVEQPELRARMGQAARRLIEQRFSLELMTETYAAVYGQLMLDKGAKAE